MQYNLFCLATSANIIWLKLIGYSPEQSKYPWYLYIDSYLEPEYAWIAEMSLRGNVEWLKITQEKLTAKQMDYKYTLRNIQYRLERFTRRTLDLIQNKI